MISQLNDLRNRMRREPKPPVREGRWMTLEEFEADPLNAHVQEVHSTVCTRTGQLFVKAIDGRFRSLSRKQLKRQIRELKGMLEQAGNVPPIPSSTPRWLKLEFLDNILEFEIIQPCGCGHEGDSGVVGEA